MFTQLLSNTDSQSSSYKPRFSLLGTTVN